MRKLKYTAGAWAMVMLLALMPAGCGKPLRATTMRLEKTEGTVRLTNQNGKKRTLKEDIRFTNGDVLRTREESYAGVSLDDTKAVMLDEESRAEFYQGKDEDWIEIDLVEGELFFNVEEKLSEDEEFEIHTSTMVMGIRGTSGHVRTQESGEDTLTVTDGTVHVTAAVPDSEDTMETDVSAGSQLRVIPADIAPSGHIEMEVRVISPEELPALALRAISEDEDLLDRVSSETGWEASRILDAAGAEPSGAEETAEETEESAEPRSEEEKAMSLYRDIVDQASSYNYDIGTVRATGRYRYALVRMEENASVPALLLSCETEDYMEHVRVFQYDAASGTVGEPQEVLLMGAAQMGGYRGGLSLGAGQTGLQLTTVAAGTGMSEMSRIHVQGMQLVWQRQWFGRIDERPGNLVSEEIDWHDTGDRSLLAAGNNSSLSPGTAAGTGTAQNTLPTDGNRIVFRGTLGTYTVSEVEVLQGAPDPNRGNGYNDGRTYRLIVLDTPQEMTLQAVDAPRKGLVRLIDVSSANLSHSDGDNLIFSIDPSVTWWPSDTSLPLGQPKTRDVHILQ